MHDARIFHVNVNCSDLERSRRFYEEGLGLHASVRTAPPVAQPGHAFGLQRARWDAWILVGEHSFGGGAIDLLQWQEPVPSGAPPGSVLETGFQRVAVGVAEIDSVVGRIPPLGGSVWGDPVTHASDDAIVRRVMASDPDGTAIELIETTTSGVVFVAVTTADLGRATDFYRTLGFRELSRARSTCEDSAHLRIGGSVAMEEVVLAPPGGGEVRLTLVGFVHPSARVAPQRAANTLGIWRMAMLVGDLDASCAALAHAGIALLSEPVTMTMGEELPQLRFVCFRGPDGEVLELIEQPR
jgi:catechol 2,3-dioxygenase-like lactoylglutathione lyase family enzyme